MRLQSHGHKVRTITLTRLKGDTIQLGHILQLEPNQDRTREVANEIILAAESRAFSLMEKARQQAAQMLQEANQEAQQVVEEAKNRRAEIIQQAQRRGRRFGFEAGYKEGRAKAETETVEMLSGADAFVEASYTARTRVLKAFKTRAADIIRHIAEKILNQTLETHPDALVGMVDAAIDSLHLTGRIRLVVSTDMLEAIRQHSNKTEETLEQLSRFELTADPQLGLREVFILSDDGNYALSPESQVKELIAPLGKILPLDPPETVLENEAPSYSEETAALELETQPLDSEELSEAVMEPVAPQEEDPGAQPPPPETV